MPTPATETLYMTGVNSTMEQYGANLRDVKTHKLLLENKDFDTGKDTKAGEYTLTDEAYAKLLDKLADRKFEGMNPTLRQDILTFYEGAKVPVFAKKQPHRWTKALAEVEQLRLVTLAEVPVQ